MPLCANAGSECFSSGCVALCGANPSAQGLQHLAVGFLFDASGQSCRLRSGAVENAFDRRGIRLITESGADLLRNRGAGRRVL